MSARHIYVAGLFLLGGCSNSVASMTCADIGNEAIRISEGDLVAINDQKQVSKSDERVVCRGTALAKDGSETPVRFQAFRSDDGEVLIKYDDDEHQARLEADAKAEQQREWAETERLVDDAMAAGRHETYLATH